MGAAYAVAVIETLYRLSNGLNQTEIALLSSVFFICYALLEIPTGGFADTFGHKTSVFWGLVIHAFAPLIVAINPIFPIFLTGSVLGRKWNRTPIGSVFFTDPRHITASGQE